MTKGKFNTTGAIGLGCMGFLVGFGIGVSIVPEPETRDEHSLDILLGQVSSGLRSILLGLVSGLVGGTGGFLIGGLFHGGTTEVKTYDLSQMSNEERIETLRRILEERITNKY